jgi:ribonuclease G
MSKELVISATPHETRVAILEDGHLCEIYIEREKEFALVGSIYKGRVTRVLPGMQSAFVDIGRDTDAFLYVSDFLENLEEYDHVLTDEVKAHSPAAPSAQRSGQGFSAPGGEPGAVPADGTSGQTAEYSNTSGEPDAQPFFQTEGAVLASDVTAEALPGEAADSFVNSSGSASEVPAQGYNQPPAGNIPPTVQRPSGQYDRPRNDRGFSGSQSRGDRDRGGRRGGGGGGGRFRRGGGKGRGDRPHGRDLPSSKYASPNAPQSSHSSHAPYDRGSGPSTPAENYEPILLPGESLAKYKERTPAPAATSAITEMDAEPPVKLAGATGSTEPAYPAAQSQESTPVLPASLYAQHEAPVHTEDAHETRHESAIHEAEDGESDEDSHDDATMGEMSGEPRRDVQDDQASQGREEEQAEDANAHDAWNEFDANRGTGTLAEGQGGTGLTHGSPADLTEEQARTLAESLIEAKHEEAVEETDDEVAHPIGGADFSETEADAEGDAGQTEGEEDSGDVNGNMQDEAHDEAADLAHDEAHNALHENAEEIHAAGESPVADSGESQPADIAGQRSDQQFNREPRSARMDDRRSARFQRPMRRGGPRGGRPMRHGRPPERHGHPGHAPQRRPQLISEMLKAGQEIIVQIAKEPLGKKGARITSHVALPGRFLVYMPTVNHIGVSRKISSAETRSRLRSIVGEYKSTFPGGFIVRTAAGNVSDQDLRSDIEFLGKTWHEICARSEQKKAPSLLHRDLNLVERILRDYVSSDYTSIWIDNEDEFSKVVEFVSRFQPDLVNRVKLYSKEAPIFEEFGIQQELDKAMRPKVWLKSGGYIVINHTEALVAIDVNTGKFVGRGSTRLEDTIVKTNLEAVKEIVRQIRLRDLGGIIIVDFIDMEERRNRDKVMHAVDDELRADKAPSKVLSFNEFGLVAITRKRTKQALEKVLCQPCPYCTGSGMVKSIPTICFEIQMEARKMAGDLDAASLTLRVHPEIAKALKTREAGLVEELESITRKSVIIQSDPTLHWEQYDIY